LSSPVESGIEKVPKRSVHRAFVELASRDSRYRTADDGGDHSTSRDISRIELSSIFYKSSTDKAGGEPAAATVESSDTAGNGSSHRATETYVNENPRDCKTTQSANLNCD